MKIITIPYLYNENIKITTPLDCILGISMNPLIGDCSIYIDGGGEFIVSKEVGENIKRIMKYNGCDI